MKRAATTPPPPHSPDANGKRRWTTPVVEDLLGSGGTRGKIAVQMVETTYTTTYTLMGAPSTMVMTYSFGPS